MEQLATGSASWLINTHSSVNEINEKSPIQDTTVPLSSPSTEIKRNQEGTIKSVNRRIKFPFGSHSARQQPHTPQKIAEKLQGSHLDSKRRMVPSIFSQRQAKQSPSIRPSVADGKLKEIIQDLSENPVENEVFEEKTIPVTGQSTWIRKSRQFLRELMEKPAFHYVIIVLIIIDLIVVFMELTIAQLSLACLTDAEMEQYNTTQQRVGCLLPPTHQLEAGETFLYYISLIIICIFVLEILGAFYAFGWRRYKKILYLIDAIIILVSFILEVYFHFSSNTKNGRASAGLVVLRLWKIIRAIHAIAHSISLRNIMIMEQVKKAREILEEEKIQAENTIREQEIKIDNLMNLLEKTKTPTTPEKTDEGIRRRANTFHQIAFF